MFVGENNNRACHCRYIVSPPCRTCPKTWRACSVICCRRSSKGHARKTTKFTFYAAKTYQVRIFVIKQAEVYFISVKNNQASRTTNMSWIQKTINITSIWNRGHAVRALYKGVAAGGICIPPVCWRSVPCGFLSLLQWIHFAKGMFSRVLQYNTVGYPSTRRGCLGHTRVGRYLSQRIYPTTEKHTI